MNSQYTSSMRKVCICSVMHTLFVQHNRPCNLSYTKGNSDEICLMGALIFIMYEMSNMPSKHECNFCNGCRNFFPMSGCYPDKSSCLPDGFYSFCNLITRSYRKIYQKELAWVLLCFEFIVLN